MRNFRYLMVFATVLSLVVGSMVSAHSATTYTLTLTLIDKDAASKITLFDDEGDQSASHGRKTCSVAKLMWLNEDPSGLDDMVYYQKIGNKSKVRVKSDSGRIVGIGTLSRVDWKRDRVVVEPEYGPIVYGTCIYSQKIKVSKSNFYSIEFSGTNVQVSTFDIALSDLIKKKWKLTLYI